MTFDKDKYSPVDFIKQISEKTHLMMLYDDKEYANAVQNQFVLEGLKKDQKCIVLSHGNSESAEKIMIDGGIDVDHYKKKNLLHIYPLDNLVNNPKGITTAFNELYTEITEDTVHPSRFVGRFISDVCTREGMELELKLEKAFHDNFNLYNCSFMCPYAVEDIESDNRNMWIKELIGHHHKFVYATHPESAVGFDSDLINSVVL